MLAGRSKKILCAVVQSYISSSEPVGSKFIARKYALNLSPATVRNIMSELEEMGFLSQPHTSAGRIPTDLGYRLYVDSLRSEIEYQPDAMSDLYKMVSELEAIKDDMDTLLNETTRRLSNFSHYLGIALCPNATISTFNRIELLKHRGSQVFAVLFTDEGLIRNKVIDVGSDLSQRHLSRISEYLNSEFHGHNIEKIRERLFVEMSRYKNLCDTLISRAVKICREALFFPHESIFISGLSEVLRLPDFTDVGQIKAIARAIEDKHIILNILEKISGTEGVRVIIGSENPVDKMRGFSIVASAYKEGDKHVGCIGVIGPTRMDYSRAITTIDMTARFITRILSNR